MLLPRRCRCGVSPCSVTGSVIACTLTTVQLHGAEPFRGNGERRSLAVNAFVSGGY